MIYRVEIEGDQLKLWTEANHYYDHPSEYTFLVEEDRFKFTNKNSTFTLASFTPKGIRPGIIQCDRIGYADDITFFIRARNETVTSVFLLFLLLLDILFL